MSSPMTERCDLRIDDLARQSGTTVDTIRYYAREGLLPPPTPSGRHKLYGPAHVERLERIKELQERRFSLAAIRAILTTDRPGLDGIFDSGDHEFTLDELAVRSGVGLDLVEDLRAIGLIRDPADVGNQAYDDRDLAALRAVAELLEIGMTPAILAELAAIYVRKFGELQQEVHAMLAGWTRDDWAPGEMEAVQRQLTSNAQRMIPAVDQLLNYVHQRTVQRLTLESVRHAQATNTGVGGLRDVTIETEERTTSA
jgi:DNA-binding transcriptional MerR regulator